MFYLDPPFCQEGRMSKYSIFGEYLKKRPENQIELSFHRIEEILGFQLPPTAYKQRAWWSNNTRNSVMTKVWRRAGFKTEAVDMAKKRLVFRRVPPPPPPQTPAEQQEVPFLERLRRKSAAAGMADSARLYSAEKETSGTPPRCRHPLYGALKGYIRIMPGVDLTEPADAEWGERAWGDDTK